MSTINWNQTLATTGTVMETGANIYASIQRGEMKAIHNEMEANNIRFGQEMAKLDKKSQLDEISLQYEEQGAAMAENFANATESQMMEVMMQGRTMDSLSSVQASDERNYIDDQAKNLLSKEYQEGVTEADYNIQKAMGDIDINNLKASSDIAKMTGKSEAAREISSGLTTLTKNNAFDPTSYSTGTDKKEPKNRYKKSQTQIEKERQKYVNTIDDTEYDM